MRVQASKQAMHRLAVQRYPVGIWQILKFFDQIPQGTNERSIKSVKKAPTPGEKI